MSTYLDIKDENFKEKDLHELLTKFVSTKLIRTKNIVHQNSKKKDSKGEEISGSFLHPDIVGVNYSFWGEGNKDKIKIINSLQNSLTQNGTSIYSFELKQFLNKRNLRKSYFQAVSNSSWANYGYLVGIQDDESESFYEEIYQLTNQFGIGVIFINIEDFEKTRIFSQSKYNEKIDWDFVKRASLMNDTFYDFINSVNTDLESSIDRIKFDGKDFDKIISEEELQNSCQRIYELLKKGTKNEEEGEIDQEIFSGKITKLSRIERIKKEEEKLEQMGFLKEYKKLENFCKTEFGCIQNIREFYGVEYLGVRNTIENSVFGYGDRLLSIGIDKTGEVSIVIRIKKGVNIEKFWKKVLSIEYELRKSSYGHDDLYVKYTLENKEYVTKVILDFFKMILEGDIQ